MVVGFAHIAIYQLGDNHIQNFHLGRYIVGYTVGNSVLRRRVSGAVKRNFRTYIQRYTSPNENFEYGYPHSYALLTFSLQKDSENVLFCAYTSSDASCIKPLVSCIYSLVNQWKATLRNDVGFPPVYRRIYCRKFMTLSNQTSRCICKCIRMTFINTSMIRIMFEVYLLIAPFKIATFVDKPLFIHSSEKP